MKFYLAIQVWLVYVLKPVLKFSKCVIRFCISNFKETLYVVVLIF